MVWITLQEHISSHTSEIVLETWRSHALREGGREVDIEAYWLLYSCCNVFDIPEESLHEWAV
jgi:hypothetical protein